jgi:hypothetical protein
MTPIVNTEINMPDDMLKALSLFETFCIMSQIKNVTEEQVKNWLIKNNYNNLALKFQTNYLY